MKQYKILILSDSSNNEVIEDLYLSKAFRKDGNLVRILGIGYNENYDEKFDLIIRRNTWQENTIKTPYYNIRNDMLIRRLPLKKVKSININGFQETNKEYLSVFFKEGRKVLPTISYLKEMGSMLAKWDKDFILRDEQNYFLGAKPVVVSIDNIKDVYSEKYLIQANIKFKSQVQFHFIGDKFMYAYEYFPAKYSRYSKQKLIRVTEKERKLAQEFAQESRLKVGMQRIDFIRLLNDDLMLSEIQDTSVHMSLEKLESDIREEVIEEYKRNIYEFLEATPEEQSKMINARNLYTY